MLSARRAAPFIGLLLVVGVDLVRRREWPLVTAGLLDESAHVVTALLAHRACGLPTSRSALGGTLAGATLLDLDHVPHHLGSRVLTSQTDRPLTHSLVSVLAVAAGACVAPTGWRLAVACAAFGAATQLVRDLGTGLVPLWWPFSKRQVSVPYVAYLAVLLLAAIAAAAQDDE